MPIRRILALLALLALAAAAAGVASGAPARACKVKRPKHTEAVFGHSSTRAAAVRLERMARRAGFQGLVVADNGCSDWEVALPLTGADNATVRSGLVKEAASVAFYIAFRQIAPLFPIPPGYVNARFGSFRTISAANDLFRQVARAGFQYVDVDRRSGRWLVLVPRVPLDSTRKFARDARKTGFHVTFMLP